MSLRFDTPRDVRSGRLTLSSAQRRWVKELYAAEVRELDEALGRLFSGLRELGLFDRALIVFTSDHGEECWEHRAFEHGHTVYDEVIAVPLILMLAQQELGRRVDRPVSIESVAPTVLSLSSIGSHTTALYQRTRTRNPC